MVQKLGHKEKKRQKENKTKHRNTSITKTNWNNKTKNKINKKIKQKKEEVKSKRHKGRRKSWAKKTERHKWNNSIFQPSVSGASGSPTHSRRLQWARGPRRLKRIHLLAARRGIVCVLSGTLCRGCWLREKKGRGERRGEGRMARGESDGVAY